MNLTLGDDFITLYVFTMLLLQHPQAPLWGLGAVVAVLIVWLSRLSRKLNRPVVAKTEPNIEQIKDTNQEKLDLFNARVKLKKRLLLLVLAQGIDDFTRSKSSPFYLTKDEAHEMKVDCAIKLGLPELAPRVKKGLMDKMFKPNGNKMPKEDHIKAPPAPPVELSLEERLTQINSRQAA